MTTTPRIGALFAGYGGLEMAARSVLGGTVAWHSEIDPGACRVLAHHYLDVPNLGDVAAIDWAAVLPVDVLTAGFPCTDISNAGQRAGIEGAHSGLWRHVADAVGVLRPRLVVLENVSALLVRGLDRVLADLAALGYDARWTCVRAADVGAPHRRERWFAVAHPSDDGHERAGGARVGRAGPADHGAPAAHADRDGLRQQPVAECGRRGAAVALVAGPDGAPADAGRDARTEGHPDESAAARRGGAAVDWGQFEPAIRRWESVLGRPAPDPAVDGQRGNRVLSPVFVEWLMGLPAGHVTGVPDLSRSQQLRMLGNGVVPQQGAAALRWLLTPTASAAA